MYGPNGLGILYAKKKWVDELPPYQGGGGMISEVRKEEISYAESPTKFEAGTMQTAEVVAFAEALNFIEEIGIKKIASHENEVLQYGLEKLRKNNSVNIIGNPKNRASIISFKVKHKTDPLSLGSPIIFTELFFLNFSNPYCKISFS